METRRIAGTGAQEPNSPVPLPSQTILGLYPQILRELPVGIVLLLLEDPSDVKTFRIVDANPAGSLFCASLSSFQ